MVAGTATPTINTGEKLYFKATGLTPTSSAGIGTFTVSKQFNLLGNCMSMLFGDEAESNLDLIGYNYAFSRLFYNCSTLKLVSAGFLPATTLATSCYSEMFYGCTGLTTAPELPATTLVNYCYIGMFQNCSNLNYIKAMFTTTPNVKYTAYWVSGVASTGTFVKNASATWNVIGTVGVPSGWTIITEQITFTINDTSYQAEEGMTWKDWVNSEYNTDGYFYNGFSDDYDPIWSPDGTEVVYISNPSVTLIFSREFIIPQGNYITDHF